MPAVDGPTTISVDTPLLGIQKRRFVIGNDSQWQRNIANLLPGDDIIYGWLTIKSSPAATDISGAQESITTVPSSQGQVVGFECIFNLRAVDTLVFNPGPLYNYDIKIQCTPSGNIYTIEQGWISFLPEVGDQPISAVNPAQFLPPTPPILFEGIGAPGVIVGALVGARYWRLDIIPGQPCEYVYDGTIWHIVSVVSYGPTPVGGPAFVLIADLPAVLFGPAPPPNGLVAAEGTRYWVTPPVKGQPAEYVMGSDGAFHVTSVVSY